MQNTDGPCVCMRTFRGSKTLTRSLTCEKIGLALLEYDVTCPSCPNCAVLPYDKDPWWGWGQSDLLPLSWESSLKRRQIMMKFTTPSVYRTPYAFSWNVWKIQIPNSTQRIVIFWGIISSCLQDSFEMWTTKPWTFSVGLMLSLQTSQFGARISKLMLPFFSQTKFQHWESNYTVALLARHYFSCAKINFQNRFSTPCKRHAITKWADESVQGWYKNLLKSYQHLRIRDL